MWLQKNNTILHSRGTSESVPLTWVTQASFCSTEVCKVKKSKEKTDNLTRHKTNYQLTSNCRANTGVSIQAHRKMFRIIMEMSTYIQHWLLPDSLHLLSRWWVPVFHRNPYRGKIQADQISLLVITHKDFRLKQIYWPNLTWECYIENTSAESI